MKKRFLKRVQNRYLQRRFPENLVPKKAVSNSNKTRLGLLALSSQQKGKNQISSSLARSINLSPQLKRGARSLHQRRLGLNCSPSLQIDALERGSLTSTFDGNVDPGVVASNNTSCKQPMVFSSKVWIKRRNWLSRFPHKKVDMTCFSCFSREKQLPALKKSKSLDLDPLFLVPPLDTPVASNLSSSLKKHITSNLTGRKTKKVISLYSSSQLESALTRQQEKRSSAFLLQLMERKKLRILYGNLSNRETNTLIVKAIKGRGRFGDVLFRLLESRLDVVICKIGFFPTIPFARQCIYHGKVLVNNEIITLANYLLQPGDIISISQTNQHFVHNCIHQRVGALFMDLSERVESRSQYADKKDYSVLPAPLKQAASSLAKINLLVLPWLEHLRSLKGTSFIYRSNKTKFPLSAWQLNHKFVRNKFRAFALKLPHVEVSYKLLKAVYLYPSQRVVFPATIDIEKILNS